MKVKTCASSSKTKNALNSTSYPILKALVNLSISDGSAFVLQCGHFWSQK